MRFLAACALLLLSLGAAHADTLTDSLGPRGVALGEALRAAPYGSAATVVNPAGVALHKSYVIEGSYAFRASDDGSLASLSVCDSTPVRVGACVFYDYQGASGLDGDGHRRLHQAGLTVAVPIADTLFLGSTTRYIDYSETGVAAMPVDGSRDGALTTDVGLVAKMGTKLNLGIAGYNVIGHDDQDFPIAMGGGIAVFPLAQMLIAADARWNFVNKSGRYGAGAEYLISTSGGQAGYPLRAGFVYDDLDGAMHVSGGIGYVTPRIALDGAVRQQVDGGRETVLQIGLRLFLPN